MLVLMMRRLGSMRWSASIFKAERVQFGLKSIGMYDYSILLQNNITNLLDYGIAVLCTVSLRCKKWPTNINLSQAGFLRIDTLP